jgi:hypothetical protein
MFIGANASGGEPDATTPPFTVRDGVHGARYCEVLLVTGRLNQVEATIYNTLGLNECPDELWQALDTDAIKDENHARAAILNGPRYFLMDKVGIVDPGTETFDFGGLQMRRLATLPLGLGDLLGGHHRRPYSEQSVRRTTVYVYDRDREVYELVAPDGTTYIMQSYSLEVDPTLTEADLARLGERLELPDGWRYRVRRLEDEWSLRIDREARVIQDELQNTYQRVDSVSASRE